MIQFLKQRSVSGEQEVCPSLLKNIEIYPFGNGFIHDGDDIGPHREMVEAGWRFMEEELKRTKYDMVILDEIASALSFHLLSTDTVKNFLTQKNDALHVILTGENMPKELVEIADTVTEMKEIKHVYQKGIDATPGLDY
jgi:cob(I)alamin adenosyltransferase